MGAWRGRGEQASWLPEEYSWALPPPPRPWSLSLRHSRGPVLEKYDMEGLRKNGTKNTGTRDKGDPQRTRLCSDSELLCGHLATRPQESMQVIGRL